MKLCFSRICVSKPVSSGQCPILDDLFHVHAFILLFTNQPNIRRCLSGDSEPQPDGVSPTSHMHCTLLFYTVAWIQTQGIASNLQAAMFHRGVIRKLPKQFCNTGFYCHQFIRQVFERSHQITRWMYLFLRDISTLLL